MKLLLVEDDDRVAAAQQQVLRRHGMQVVRASTARQALELLRARPDFDVMVLDLGLPDGDGLTLCRDVRRISEIPMIISSARSDVATRLHGLHTGADDYLVKPYDLRELVARVHVVVRRRARLQPNREDRPAAPGANQGLVQVGDVAIDIARRVVTVSGEPVTLTTREFDVLALLACAPGVVYGREQILGEIWGLQHGSDDHTLDVHVARIRRKVGVPTVITTVRGVGFRLGTAGG